MERSCLERRWVGSMLALLAIAGLGLGSPADATTLIRLSLEKLTHDNSTVAVGEVVDLYSYWNADGTFILTDVVIEPYSMLKGVPSKDGRMTLTLMGGQVGELTAVIVGGANLEVGKSYLLFSAVSDLPGAPKVATVQHHSQGVFELFEGADGSIRAISQAASHELVSDKSGEVSPPGGAEGIALDRLIETITKTIAAPAGKQGVSQ